MICAEPNVNLLFQSVSIKKSEIKDWQIVLVFVSLLAERYGLDKTSFLGFPAYFDVIDPPRYRIIEKIRSQKLFWLSYRIQIIDIASVYCKECTNQRRCDYLFWITSYQIFPFWNLFFFGSTFGSTSCLQSSEPIVL